ncbi:hypothetical protein ACLKA6_006593 [Drosophila palustris]
MATVDELIRLLEGGGGARPSSAFIPMDKKDIQAICHDARQVFLSENMCLAVSAPIVVVGDVHGQFEDLLRILRIKGFPPMQRYLFLGDYVDRGKHSLETLTLLLCYKIRYPDCVFLLRGNHESQCLNQIYGFYDECKRRYSAKLWKTFVDCYSCMPVAAVVSNRVFCCHGGLSPSLTSIQDINNLSRPTDIPISGLLCDLLWSDPDRSFGWKKSSRGVSWVFGSDVVERFLLRYDFDLICRGHQVVEDGYELFAKRQLVTVFSAPNYCGVFDNAGATMAIDNNLMITFDIYKSKAFSNTVNTAAKNVSESIQQALSGHPFGASRH